jgi:hypothetical protein
VSQVNEPGFARAFQAVREVRKMHSPHHQMRVVRERGGELAQWAQMDCVVVQGSAGGPDLTRGQQTIAASVVRGRAGLLWRAEAESTARVNETRKALRPVIWRAERAPNVIETANGWWEAMLSAIGSRVECRGRYP